MVHPGSVQVMTTAAEFVNAPLSGVSTGGAALMMMGEANAAASLTSKPSLVATALIEVPVLETLIGDTHTGESSVAGEPSTVQ